MITEKTEKFEKDLKLGIRQISFNDKVLKVEKAVYLKALALVPHLAQNSKTMPTIELGGVPVPGESDSLRIKYGKNEAAEIEIRPSRNYIRLKNPDFLMAFNSEIQPEIWKRLNKATV